MSKQPSIAIIGAGPGGLTLANILHRHGWHFDVYEADASPTVRDQGGSLDLHPEDGQVALERAGLLDVFLAVARHEDQEQRVRDFSTGKLLRQKVPKAGEGTRPEIDRHMLRELMLAPLDPQVIKWGMRVNKTVAQLDGRYTLETESGVVGPYDLVVGSDGAWSTSRSLLTNIKPVYSGATFVELWFNDVDSRHPDISEFVGRGTMFSLHGGAGLIAQRNGNAAIRVYAAFKTTPKESNRPDKVLATITKDQVLLRFPCWAASLLALIARSDCIAAVRPISSMPAPVGWRHREGLTLIGDAAHVMPPLGLGVNLAMLDASDLGMALVKHDDWRLAQRQYENLMFERSTPVVEAITTSFDAWFSDDATRTILDAMDSHESTSATE